MWAVQACQWELLIPIVVLDFSTCSTAVSVEMIFHYLQIRHWLVYSTWYLLSLQQWLWRLIPSGMWHHVFCQLLTTLHDPMSQKTVILILQCVAKWHTRYSDFVWEFSGIWNVYAQIDHKLKYILIDAFWGACHLMKRCKCKKGKI